ncbi:MAG: H-NS histone family protein [Chlorobiaceae bacterium]|jgi:DNA-binding protein H-NS|nr:H-NS histone family protein [Chlorobiaceae bacterium]
MPTIAEIDAQIKELQEKKSKLQAEGKRNAIKQIKAVMAEYGISIEELQIKAVIEKPIKEKGPSVIKYRKSETETWVGRGPKPKWIKEIEQKGGNIERYRVSTDDFFLTPKI